MPKRASKHLRAPRPLGVATHAHLELKADGEWMVQPMSAQAATKTYACPGCNRSFGPGVAHLVAWPRLAGIGSTSAVEERRHWHTACWNRRP